MAIAAPKAQPPPPSVGREALGDAVMVLRACDVVFGPITAAVAVLMTVAALAGKATVGAALLVWAVPAFNVPWSALSKRSNPFFADHRVPISPAAPVAGRRSLDLCAKTPADIRLIASCRVSCHGNSSASSQFC